MNLHLLNYLSARPDIKVEVRFKAKDLAFSRPCRDLGVLVRRGMVSPNFNKHGYLTYLTLLVPRAVALRAMKATLPINNTPRLVSKRKMTGMHWPEFAGTRMQPRGRTQPHHCLFMFGG